MKTPPVEDDPKEFRRPVPRRYETITVSNPSRFSSHAQDWINNRLTLGGDTYEWKNVYKEKAFSDMRAPRVVPTHYESSDPPLEWFCNGNVWKNGLAWGQYAFPYNPADSSLKFTLVTPDQTIPLETYSRF